VLGGLNGLLKTPGLFGIFKVSFHGFSGGVSPPPSPPGVAATDVGGKILVRASCVSCVPVLVNMCLTPKTQYIPLIGDYPAEYG
jgi:hypothetical protein